ncbi:MAG: FAD-binding oxidoreductase [Proteobacteria bacterium]|jgi:FAD/FMN-containing dehydrogenase|nr:FAD-binding oxidoreductase [Pseudomonadota bacterium]MDA1302663.1 FAD-binding oxidoreductase [Pseudomonadota bacterium]
MAITDELIAALGTDAVLTGDDVSSRPISFWRPHQRLTARALVRPSTTEQLAAALKLCNDARQTVVTHGGLTGLVEGEQTTSDDIVISLERMTRIEEINPTDRTMIVQAGAILQTIQEAAEAQGMMFPLDLGGRGSCTIGGNIATNAGGNRVVRYGMTRDMVLGLEAVLPDGTIVSSMNQMVKNNAGYDLKHLFIGSEGSLGIITRAVLRLRELPATRNTLLVAAPEFSLLPRLLKKLDSDLGGTVSAFEVMWNDFYRLVSTPPAKTAPPMSQEYPYYALIETLGATEESMQASLEAALEEGLIVDAVVAQSEAQRLQLWAMRDDVEQIAQYAPTVAFDVSLRISMMESYVEEVASRVKQTYPDAALFIFGHMGDGNLHIVVGPGVKGKEVRKKVEACVYEPLAEISGSVSAEHGIGLEKKPYLNLSRSEIEINLMRTIKKTLDPRGILNPGKIFDMAPG